MMLGLNYYSSKELGLSTKLSYESQGFQIIALLTKITKRPFTLTYLCVLLTAGVIKQARLRLSIVKKIKKTPL